MPAEAIAGLALAAPGLITLLCEYGLWIEDRVHTFNQAKPIWEDLAKFGHNLQRGKLKLNIELAKNAYDTEGFDPALKQSLDDQMARLGVEIEAAKTFLEKQNVDSVFGRSKFAITGEKRAREINNNLRKWQQDFSELMLLVHMAKLDLPDPLSLAPTKFQHDVGIGYTQIPYAPNIFIAGGEYKEKEDEDPRMIAVLIEQQDKGMTENNLRNITSHMCHRLDKSGAPRGILHCLGYRMDPAPELVFEMPESVHSPQTLQTLLAADIGKAYGGGHPLDFRFRLERQISEAVLTVHMAKLVHKNIRAETILILRPANVGSDESARLATGVGQPILSHWSYLKDPSSITNKWATDIWTQNIYRHPQRQGLHIQKRYNMGHDIYSLGVCLLELGLWDPFVLTRTADGDPKISELFRRAAKVESEEDPDVALGLVLKNPTKVKEVLLSLAQQQLPSRMGLGYTELVVACLKCLDSPSGFGEGVDFSKLKDTEAGVAFKELVLRSFSNLSF
jgi:hypothetical protein